MYFFFGIGSYWINLINLILLDFFLLFFKFFRIFLIKIEIIIG